MKTISLNYHAKVTGAQNHTGGKIQDNSVHHHVFRFSAVCHSHQFSRFTAETRFFRGLGKRMKSFQEYMPQNPVTARKYAISSQNSKM